MTRAADSRMCSRRASSAAVVSCAVAIALFSVAPPTRAEPCSLQLKVPAMVVLLLDLSGTVRHFSAFERAWQQIVAQAGDGDTVVLAAVKRGARGGTGGEFPFLEEQQLPCYSPLASPAAQKRRRASAIAALQQAFTQAMSLRSLRAGNDRTLLLSSVRSIAKHFANHDGPRRLVLATDGLEDSDVAKFETLRLTDSAIARLVAAERTAALRAQLKGVSVSVVAAGTASDQKSSEVERFWLHYFKEMGADLPPARYAGTLLHYGR